MSLYGERMARVEVEVQELKKTVGEHKAETKEQFDEVNGKLDQLLALKNKGAGVIWLVSGLIGTGIITGITQLFHWLGGK